VEVVEPVNEASAMAAIEDADAAYGTVPPAMLARARKLRWICAPLAGLGGSWFYPQLVQSDVTVTNMRAIYNEHLAAHAMAFVLAFARRFDHYLRRQAQGTWAHDAEMIDLPSTTALVVGVGGAGSEIARLCAAFGMRVVGVDPRTSEKPAGMSELATPDRLDTLLGDADFVILTTPETPQTRGMFNAARFARMKRGSYFVTISRGVCVVTDDLVAALRSGHLAGAGLDVADPEPLPPGHPLWTMANVMLTPHVAIYGSPHDQERREAVLLENCRRFAADEPLLNVVDKRQWY
jgi:phosphoglycerate dehydrogenase-like enzyme